MSIEYKNSDCVSKVDLDWFSSVNSSLENHKIQYYFIPLKKILLPTYHTVSDQKKKFHFEFNFFTFYFIKHVIWQPPGLNVIG